MKGGSTLITMFGRMLRKVRIDHGEVLKDMADRLNVSPSFISAVEAGKKKVPNGWVDEISDKYDLTVTEREQLSEAANASVPTVKINLFGSNERQREAALVFARDFDSLSDETASQIINLLKRDQQ